MSSSRERVFAPEVHALQAKLSEAYTLTTVLKSYELALTPRESHLMRVFPEVFAQFIAELGGTLKIRDRRTYPRLRLRLRHCVEDDHQLYPVWSRSLWRPWRAVEGLACLHCDIFVADPIPLVPA